MKVRILAFGIAREIFGDKHIEVDIPEGSAASLKKNLEEKYPKLKELASYMLAVNDEYADENTVITETDEIAIIPPISGG